MDEDDYHFNRTVIGCDGDDVEVTVYRDDDNSGSSGEDIDDQAGPSTSAAVDEINYTYDDFGTTATAYSNRKEHSYNVGRGRKKWKGKRGRGAKAADSGSTVLRNAGHFAKPIRTADLNESIADSSIHLTTIELDPADQDQHESALAAVQAMLKDDSTSNLVERLKQAYHLTPVKSEPGRSLDTSKSSVDKWPDVVVGKRSGDSADQGSTSSSDDNRDNENDEDYIPSEYSKRKASRENKLLESPTDSLSKETSRSGKKKIWRRKGKLTKAAKRLIKHKIETSFPPRFSDVVSDSELEEEMDYDWSALTGLDADLTAQIGRKEKDSDDTESTADRTVSKRPIRSTLPDELGSLLGQANVSFAQGRTEEAMQMCHEVIRQKPNHSGSYEILGSFYEKLGDMEKYLQFSLLAAHLDHSCSGEKWAFLAQLAVDHGKLKQACDAYQKAYYAEPTVWEYYNSRMALLSDIYKDSPENLRRKILRTRLHAVRGMLKNKSLPLEEYLTFAKNVFQEVFADKYIPGSLLCLRCCLHRAFAAKVTLYAELNHFMELNMQHRTYEEALKAVFTFSSFSYMANKAYQNEVDREKFTVVGNFIVPIDFPVDLLAKTICCMVYTGRYDNAKPLIQYFDGHKSETTIDLFLDVADALTHKFLYNAAEMLLTSLIESKGLDTAAVWLCYADILSSQGRMQAACKAYSNVVELAPKHVNARLALSALQQQLGLSEEAVKTLDIGDATDMSNLDERLLCQKCILLENQNDTKAYLRCAKQFLARFFKLAYDRQLFENAQETPGSKIKLGLRTVLLSVVYGSPWERFVKRVPGVDAKSTEVSHKNVWDAFDKVYRIYEESKRYTDMLHMCCYAYCCPVLVYCGIGYVDFIIGYMLYAAIRGGNFNVPMAIIKTTIKTPFKLKNHVNLIGLSLTTNADRLTAKYILRQSLYSPDNPHIAFLVGNHALFGGMYQHSLAEFASILTHTPDDPLLNFLIGLVYINLSSQRDVVRRHDLCIQGLCFLNKYEKLRGPCQETYYNLGRAMHQIGFTYAAVYYYEKALQFGSAIKAEVDKYHSEMFDLRRIIAHNLSLIYISSHNADVASHYLEKYCTI